MSTQANESPLKVPALPNAGGWDVSPGCQG
jgi:hypothetical protein